MERQDYLDKMRKISAQQRIHPTRTFYPGQTYQPEVQSCGCFSFNDLYAGFLGCSRATIVLLILQMYLRCTILPGVSAL